GAFAWRRVRRMSSEFMLRPTGAAAPRALDRMLVHDSTVRSSRSHHSHGTDARPRENSVGPRSGGEFLMRIVSLCGARDSQLRCRGAGLLLAGALSCLGAAAVQATQPAVRPGAIAAVPRTPSSAPLASNRAPA